MDGHGESVWPNGRRYKGQYVKDRQEGFGIYHWDDGRVYCGYWEKNLQNGKGIMKMCEDGQWKEIKGIWKEGVKVQGADESFEEILRLKEIEEKGQVL